MVQPDYRAGVQDSNLRALAGALGCSRDDDGKELGCSRDDLADWIDDGQGPKPPGSNLIERPPEFPYGRVVAGPEAAQARLEREIGMHADKVVLPSGTYPLVGFDLRKQCEIRYAELASCSLAIMGRVADWKGLSRRTAEILGAKIGHGAGSFKISRIVQGLVGKRTTGPLSFDATVFAAQSEHGKALEAAQRSGTDVAALCRITLWQGAGSDWEGFFIFENEPQPWPWAYVVDEIWPEGSFSVQSGA